MDQITVPVQQQFLDKLKKIDRPGTFSTSGRLLSIFPGLEVEGVGPVALPLGKREAATLLKKQARQAPYGGAPRLSLTRMSGAPGRSMPA